MFRTRTLAVVLIIGLCTVTVGFSQELEDNWNDLLHYTMIGRLDLAKGYAQAIIDSNPDPVALLELSAGNAQGYNLLTKAKDSQADPLFAELCGKVLDIIEQGKFIRRADPKVIVEEIKRLSSTERGKMEAMKRLQNAGEYAIMYMLDAMADKERKEEMPNIVWALSRMSRDAVRPLSAALQTSDVAIKTEIIKAMGEIGYPQSLAYLKYVAEKDESSELRALAETSIRKINAGIAKVPAAQLFYRLGEDYYYHAESLAPQDDADFANVWFWDANESRLYREQVDRKYFNELMAMRCCEWALETDATFGQAIGLWLAAFFKAESTGVGMPKYFGEGHADAMTYATTAGAEYLHQALARAVGDKDASVALGAIEALATTAGTSSLFYRVGTSQPLADALSFDSKAVKYSAAIAIASAGPRQSFPESRLVMENLADGIGQSSTNVTATDMWSAELADAYAVRCAEAMLKLAQTRNNVLDLSLAQGALAAATKDTRPEIQMLAGQVLAYLSNAEAQNAIATMALNEDYAPDIRVSAFGSLAISGKLNGNLLDDSAIDKIYLLVGSSEQDASLRSAAAAAYGALNLPSRKVKDLILDQARS